MARNCSGFLQRQIMAIKPQVVITLGKDAYFNLRFLAQGYDEALCLPVHTSSFLLFAQLGFHFWFLPWPHPSGLNRWHNIPENRQRLQESLGFIHRLLGGGSEEK